eukprot:TRINITY_DN1533_c0_g1_i10.p1 TRINITY_DN1533_c0_g1~~TRINITY_DN1533_c0_g1_i10.p1  ORF type:complete len:266 (-),score=46.78 TRINITY_DN1533_c0_g1_i10:19-816(-)
MGLASGWYALVGGTAALVALLLWGSQAGPPGDSILLEMEEEKTLPVQFDEKCAQRFKPVVYLSVGEKYGPSPLEAFLATCTMRRGMRCGDTRKINFAYGGEYYSSGLIELDSEDQFGAAVPQPIHHHDFEAALRTTQEFVSDVAELCVVQKTSIMYSISQCDHGDDPIVGHQVTVDNISPMYKRANCSTDNHTGKGGCYLRCLGCGSPSQPVCELSLIHISEPTRLLSISYAVFCLKKKKKYKKKKTKLTVRVIINARMSHRIET